MIDRICAATSVESVFAARGNSAQLQALNPRGCVQRSVSTQRTGFVPYGRVVRGDGLGSLSYAIDDIALMALCSWVSPSVSAAGPGCRINGDLIS